MPETPRSVAVIKALGIPIAILLGFGLIAGAIYMSRPEAPQTAIDTTGSETETVSGDIAKIDPVSDADHIRGNPNAPIVFVEYSDYDCPFCKNFHETMKRIMEEYGTDGQVAWVYRHYPIEQLHPSAPKIAAAAECVAELGGNTAFWSFSDLVFEERGINEPTDMSRLPEFAETAGVDQAAFNTCVANGDGEDGVAADFTDAQEIGAQGTPHTIVLVGDQQGIINGAQPYAVVHDIVESLLKQIEGEAN